MNLLLFDAEEVTPDGTVILTDRRAEHLSRVLRVEVGGVVRAGCIGSGLGTAEVLALDGRRIQCRYTERRRVPRPTAKVLLLAVPRPKVLSRCIEHAAALGFTGVVLFRTHRVDKAHLESHKLRLTDLRRHSILGMEQAGLVHLPELSIFTRFKPFVEDELEAHVTSTDRFVAHPSASARFREAQPTSTGYTLALGPEGGFIPHEIEALCRRGFLALRGDVGTLRVESALSYFAGQLDAAAVRSDAASFEE